MKIKKNTTMNNGPIFAVGDDNVIFTVESLSETKIGELTFATEDQLDVAHARQVLDEDHYDLEDIKEAFVDGVTEKYGAPSHKYYSYYGVDNIYYVKIGERRIVDEYYTDDIDRHELERTQPITKNIALNIQLRERL